MAADVNGTVTLREPARNRYFFGKLLDEKNLALEQGYLNDKRWLLNRLSLGAGVVCGLEVAVANDNRRLVVRPGVAIDGLGREIVVPLDSPPIDPRRPTDAYGRPGDTTLSGERTMTVCLAYHECPADPVPVLVADCDSRDGCAPGTVRERYAVSVREGAPPTLAPSDRLDGLFTDDHASLLAVLDKMTMGACATPPGEPACVVLARVRLPAADDGRPAVEIAGVRPLVATNMLLLDMLLSLAARVEECCRNHR
jgi:hypothetical protein